MKFYFKKAKDHFYKYSSNFFIIIGILNILYCFFGLSLGWGFYFGLKVIFASGIFLLIHGLLKSYNNFYKNSKATKFINWAIIISLLSFIILEILIFTGAYINDLEDIDYVLILGAGIIDDRPSLELKYRLDKAIKFIEKNPSIKKVILCGGVGEDEKFSEAYVMEKYLLNKGIHEDMLIKEEESTSTYENIKYAKKVIEIIDSRHNVKIAISSNDFHLFRAKYLAKKLGFEAAGLPSKTPLYIIPNHHVRECFAIVKAVFIR
ncbi:YdcF family protein [Maledivibacter halophilus]|uniref:Uncharacterized SAM-binding protein YcdF, DUF218 family n=1 Tax=Maledivibacter halophilus TaxID=36842 RepID=A0A1T5LDQ8_9FIRM|nr:YdcF family protein [Maledivibacter halophilus]SKC73769.1 Uncharacterized SAM-binding protein YcdF, DUF218 family [Maledivibacter halophilus]